MEGDSGPVPRRARRGVVAIDLTLIVGLLVLLATALDLRSATARRFPLLALGVTLALLAVDLAGELLPAVRRRLAVFERGLIEVPEDVARAVEKAAAGAPEDREAETPRAFRDWVVLLWITALGIGMYAVGYLIAIPVFIVAFSVYARVPPKVWIGTTLAVVALNYFALYQVFNLR
jgi:hypothetical protein